MKHYVDNQDEALEIIAAYLERLGVEGLRQQYTPDQINRSALIRYLINEKLQEVLANPSAPEGTLHRAGQAKKRKAPPMLDTQPQKLRRGSKS